MDVGKEREQDAASFAYMDVGKEREQDAASFAYMDVGKEREQDALRPLPIETKSTFSPRLVPSAWRAVFKVGFI